MKKTACLLSMLVVLVSIGCATPDTHHEPEVLAPEILDNNPFGSAEIKACAKQIGPQILTTPELTEGARPVNIVVKPIANNTSFGINPLMITNELKNELAVIAYAQGRQSIRFITQDRSDKALMNDISASKLEAKRDKMLDAVADALLASPAIAQASKPPVIAVAPVLNTNLINMNANSVMAMLRAKIAGKAAGKVAFTAPGTLKGADYVLTGEFIAESLKTEGMINVADYITLIEERIQAGKTSDIQSEVTLLLDDIRRHPGNLRQCTALSMKSYTTLLEALEKYSKLQNVPDVTKRLNVMLVKKDTKISAFEKMFSLEQKTKDYLDNVDFILTGELSSISGRSSGKESIYVVASFRLVNPENGMELWFGRFESKKALRGMSAVYR